MMLTLGQIAKMAKVSREVAREWVATPERFGFPTPVGYDGRGVLFDESEVRTFLGA